MRTKFVTLLALGILCGGAAWADETKPDAQTQEQHSMGEGMGAMDSSAMGKMHECMDSQKGHKDCEHHGMPKKTKAKKKK